MAGLCGEALHKGDGTLEGLGLGETGGVVAGGMTPAAVAVGAAKDSAGSTCVKFGAVSKGCI